MTTLPLFDAQDEHIRLSAFRDWRPTSPPDLSPYSVIYLDTETTGLEWWAGKRIVGIAVGDGVRTAYLPFGHVGGNLDELTVLRWAQRELRNKRIVGLNTRFDVHMMREWGVDLVEQGCTFSDVAHSAALLDDHRRKFSLNALALDYLKKQKIDLDVREGLAHYHAGEVAEYACTDVMLVMELEAVMKPLLDKEGLHTVMSRKSVV